MGNDELTDVYEGPEEAVEVSKDQLEDLPPELMSPYLVREDAEVETDVDDMEGATEAFEGEGF